MNKLNTFFLFLFAFFLSTDLFGQDWIQGIVLNKNGEPLIGANVWLKGTNIGVTTDLDGVFELDIQDHLNIFDIEISYVGYQKQRRSIFLDEFDLYQQHTFILEENYLEEIQVFAYSKKIKKDNTCCCVPLPKDQFYFPIPQSPSLNIDIFPNPFTHFFNLQWDAPKSATYIFELHSLNGQMLFSQQEKISKGRQQLSIDVASLELPNGNYLIKINQNEIPIHSEILIKASSL